jgi:hypothetical protein
VFHGLFIFGSTYSMVSFLNGLARSNIKAILEIANESRNKDFEVGGYCVTGLPKSNPLFRDGNKKSPPLLEGFSCMLLRLPWFDVIGERKGLQISICEKN